MVKMRLVFNCFFVLLFFCSVSGFAKDNSFGDSDVLSVLQSQKISEVEKKAVDDPKYAYVAAVAYLNGVDLVQNKVKIDKKKGIHYLESSERKGFSAASYLLGAAYCKGYGVKKDPKKCFCYTKEAAEADHPYAQKKLGKAYLDKSKKIFNEKKGAYWYEKSASHGDEDSIITIGNFYRMGRGVNKDMEKAFYWYSKGVQQDSMTAQREIAALYASGEGTDKDLVMAYMMYDLGGTAGIEGKKKVAQEMTEDQIKEAIAKSRRWQEEHKAFRPSYSGLEYQSDGSYR